jgi:hypothetical protein
LKKGARNPETGATSEISDALISEISEEGAPFRHNACDKGIKPR